MAISILDIIQEVGAENILIQTVADSLVKYRQCKNDCEITIASAKENAPVPSFERGDPKLNYKNAGLILWIDAEKFDLAMLNLKKAEGIK